MKINYIRLNELKNFLFDLWETTYFVRINGQVFNTDNTVLTYEDADAIFEIFNITDRDFEHALWSIKKENIKTVNNKPVISNKYIATTINMKWDSSHWMKINGFLFFMSNCCQITTDEDLLIYNKETLTSICLKEINSLIIDDEVIL